MKKITKIKRFVVDNLPILIVLFVSLLSATFLFFGSRAGDGSVTLDGNNAKIEEYTKKFIEDSNDALYRIMNEDAPTDEATMREFEDAKGLGGSVTLDIVKGRRKPDGFNDDGKGLQCSKYTGYLATGRMEYSYSHPDYGPVNGKDMAAWLVNNFGWKYTDSPVEGAIGSGGFNTLYGHTAMYLYQTGEHTAMVNDANYVPLAVSTHNMNIDGWAWVVPGDYEPDPEPTPTPEPQPVVVEDSIKYTYISGDYFSKVLVDLGLDDNNLWGENGTVVYYTNQLIKQNMLDSNGNVKIGEEFTLTRK